MIPSQRPGEKEGVQENQYKNSIYYYNLCWRLWSRGNSRY